MRERYIQTIRKCHLVDIFYFVIKFLYSMSQQFVHFFILIFFHFFFIHISRYLYIYLYVGLENLFVYIYRGYILNILCIKLYMLIDIRYLGI